MIHCRFCRHYFITWDNDCPHGCRAMNFKSHQQPSTVVYESSGEACRAFEKKEPKKNLRLDQ